MPWIRSRTDGTVPAAVVRERPDPAELNALFVALGWGEHSLDVLGSSIAAYTATVCARTPDGLLVGYASVFSDRCLTTMFGEFVVHPEFQRQGVGQAMMGAVEREFPSTPIYVKALGAAREFIEALGFRTSSTPVTSMFKRPAGAERPRSLWGARKHLPLEGRGARLTGGRPGAGRRLSDGTEEGSRQGVEATRVGGGGVEHRASGGQALVHAGRAAGGGGGVLRQ